MKEQGLTWHDVMQQYRQPVWCGYPEALSGMMGCWSLTLRKIKRQSDCGNCELIKHENQQDALNE